MSAAEVPACASYLWWFYLLIKVKGSSVSGAGLFC